jgi:methylated-DNA-[protein]-cysteine S-methyltransferase
MNDPFTHRQYFSSPFGFLEIQAGECGIFRIHLQKDEASHNIENPDDLTNACVEQLVEYFAGTRKKFDLPLDFSRAPFFQQEVWRTVYSIPYGKTRSYEDIAVRLGKPGAVRAVGMANARNPIPIVVPCHRVIGKNGKLTGYAYGLEIKRALLKLENPKKFVDQAVLFH